jgi:hypothetical protein
LPSLFIRALTDRPLALTAEIEVHGWKDRSQRIVDTDISSIEPIQTDTRVAKQARAYPEGQISEQLRGQRVLASVSADVADVLPDHGTARVGLVVTPLGDTATLVIDEVFTPVHTRGAAVTLPDDSAAEKHQASSMRPAATAARVKSLSATGAVRARA